MNCQPYAMTDRLFCVLSGSCMFYIGRNYLGCKLSRKCVVQGIAADQMLSHRLRIVSHPRLSGMVALIKPKYQAPTGHSDQLKYKTGVML